MAGATHRDGTTAAKYSTKRHFTGFTLEKGNSMGSDVGYLPPVKRHKAALHTPENSQTTTDCQDATTTPPQSSLDTSNGDGDHSRNPLSYNQNFIPNYILPPNSHHHHYSPLNKHYPLTTYHPPQTQYYRASATHHSVQTTNQGQLANYFSPPVHFLRYDDSQDSNHNALAMSTSLPSIT